MVSDVKIEQVQSIKEYIKELSEFLIEVVLDGASIGFLPPLKYPDATMYWESVLSPDVILFVAKINNKIVGTAQLHLCTKQNGTHRAEIAKLMTHPNYRRNGIARLLMHSVEERAKREYRSLIVLDTREGDPSNLLYTSLGFVQAGPLLNLPLAFSMQLFSIIRIVSSTYRRECN